MDNNNLLDAVNKVMPYGKYKGRQLLALPEPYLVWFHSKGFPQGKLGTQLAFKRRTMRERNSGIHNTTTNALDNAACKVLTRATTF